MAKKWIKGAIKHPGALHKELGVPVGENIPRKKLESAAGKGGALGKRARFAEELESFHHGHTNVRNEKSHAHKLNHG